MDSSRLTPASGVWSVPHAELAPRNDAAETSSSKAFNADNCGAEVSFYWTEPAQSAYVTGTFNNWEALLPMHQVNTRDGVVWIASKALRPGEYQYKFIVDNSWRYAPEQCIAIDERGIVNNSLIVTLELCGDASCYCATLQSDAATRNYSPLSPASDNDATRMDASTARRFQRATGVATSYTERLEVPQTAPAVRSYMHKAVNDRPFDVVVTDVQKLREEDIALPRRELPRDGLISRTSSTQDIFAAGEMPVRYDPTLAHYKDAMYNAALRADASTSMPKTAPGRAALFNAEPTEFHCAVRARLSPSQLGFNPAECSAGIGLLENQHCAVRVEREGLYKSVRGMLPLGVDRRTYFEMYICEQERSAAVSVGLSTCELPLSCLVGTRPNSVGFSTSGNLIRTVDGRETWTRFGEAPHAPKFNVGCLVDLQPVPFSEGSVKRTRAKVTFYVDGAEIGNAEYVFVGELEIFPTLSLYACHSRVYALFDAKLAMHGGVLPDAEEVLTLDGKPVNRGADAAAGVDAAVGGAD